MPKVSINILTKNRAELLKKALASVKSQSFTDFEIVIVDDGSTDGTAEVLKDCGLNDLKIVSHPQSVGITLSRQEALQTSVGEFVAILDDDDEWVDISKLKKQVEFLDANPDCVLVGGGMRVDDKFQMTNYKFRPEADEEIRKTMLARNNFFTSTVMFRRDAAIKAGGFIIEGDDLTEDYDLWLRLGTLGKMHNFLEVFTAYRAPSYNKDKFKKFLQKQLSLIVKHKKDYPGFLSASLILKFRILFGI